jgi:tetratricopeptide (TPR) repeat protein
MLMTASSLGYTPATLSLIRIILDAPDERFVRLKTDLGDAVVRFLQLVRTERSPDVLTLRGLWLLREGHSDVYALKYFDQALEAAARSIPPDCGGTVHHQQQQGTTASSSSSSSSAREPRWTFEGSCHLKRGLILARQGRTEEAIASFKIVALELDLADGYAELANLLPPDAPEREGYLLRAAQAGHVEACRLLALDMAEKAVDRGLPWSDRRDAAGLAHEWSQVVTDPKRREELAVEVAEKAREVLARAQGGLLWKLTGWTTGKGV